MLLGLELMIVVVSSSPRSIAMSPTTSTIAASTIATMFVGIRSVTLNVRFHVQEQIDLALV